MNARRLINLAAATFDRLSHMIWIPALLTRLFVGYFFFESGWSKVHDLDTFAKNFAGWGIPYPYFNAVLSSYTECVGGALTMLGLGMRFVSIPMIINMAVAVISVKLKEVSSISDFVELDEPLYALTYVWLLFSGAGWPSVDALLKWAFSRRSWNHVAVESPALAPAWSNVMPPKRTQLDTASIFWKRIQFSALLGSRR